MNDSNPFFDYEPTPEPKNTKREHIIFVNGTHFIHEVSYGKRGKKTETFQPIGDDVPLSLRQKKYRSPYHYKKDKQRFDKSKMAKIVQWRAEHY